MEPMKPENKESLLQDNPQADPSEIEEYERLYLSASQSILTCPPRLI